MRVKYTWALAKRVEEDEEKHENAGSDALLAGGPAQEAHARSEHRYNHPGICHQQQRTSSESFNAKVRRKREKEVREAETPTQPQSIEAFRPVSIDVAKEDRAVECQHIPVHNISTLQDKKASSQRRYTHTPQSCCPSITTELATVALRVRGSRNSCKILDQ